MKPLVIGINAKPALAAPKTGLEEYSFQLLNHIHAIARHHRGVELRYYGPKGQAHQFPGLRGLSAPIAWTQIRLATELLLDPPDVFFNPEQILPIGAPRKSVVTIHDLAYEIYPKHYPRMHRTYLRIVTKHAAKRAKRIIAISKQTKRDIAKIYNIPLRKIDVIYHGLSPLKHPQLKLLERIKQELPIRPPYILYVGRLEKKKNIVGLIKAFELIRRQEKTPLSLVLAGKTGYGYKEIEEAIKVSIQRKYIHTPGYVSQETKQTLYRFASLFVFPSRYEGFGLPILEAQRFGIPIIANDIPALREVGGRGVEYANATNPYEMAKLALNLIREESAKKRLIKLGYDNIKHFSWETCARQTLKILLEL